MRLVICLLGRSYGGRVRLVICLLRRSYGGRVRLVICLLGRDYGGRIRLVICPTRTEITQWKSEARHLLAGEITVNEHSSSATRQRLRWKSEVVI
ncbi:hypothetical protein AVEN_107887-1 [Araneus ventricosus]|uniref:Uncharacterized protein n=1 Tax=Araneus ventricosus TaxID=182803 RepID=A0A4Y2WEQ9_ARAVE|nr:hypothetical protein AVEN_107887-1 [Araneus ventricosus]